MTPHLPMLHLLMGKRKEVTREVEFTRWLQSLFYQVDHHTYYTLNGGRVRVVTQGPKRNIEKVLADVNAKRNRMWGPGRVLTLPTAESMMKAVKANPTGRRKGE